jgi:ABC-2 type transport system ATP-binding protein
MIEVQELTKRYGPAVAVDRLAFTVRPGTVTGFLGPNGSGKSTTLRMIMGLDAADSGQARIGGRAIGYDGPGPQPWLSLLVRNDGTGGADAARGSGLAGLAQRVAVVDGRLVIVSPPGGPTLVSVELPLQA